MTATPPVVTLINSSMGIVDTNMGWPMFTERDALEVGDRNPPRDGVKTGVSMEGGMNSKSRKRSMFD